MSKSTDKRIAASQSTPDDIEARIAAADLLNIDLTEKHKTIVPLVQSTLDALLEFDKVSGPEKEAFLNVVKVFQRILEIEAIKIGMIGEELGMIVTQIYLNSLQNSIKAQEEYLATKQVTA